MNSSMFKDDLNFKVFRIRCFCTNFASCSPAVSQEISNQVQKEFSDVCMAMAVSIHHKNKAFLATLISTHSDKCSESNIFSYKCNCFPVCVTFSIQCSPIVFTVLSVGKIE